MTDQTYAVVIRLEERMREVHEDVREIKAAMREMNGTVDVNTKDIAVLKAAEKSNLTKWSRVGGIVNSVILLIIAAVVTMMLSGCGDPPMIVETLTPTVMETLAPNATATKVAPYPTPSRIGPTPRMTVLPTQPFGSFDDFLPAICMVSCTAYNDYGAEIEPLETDRLVYVTWMALWNDRLMCRYESPSGYEGVGWVTCTDLSFDIKQEDLQI